MGHGEEVAQQLKLGFVATIDCLPDDLLVHILSFLPTKPAASTSVLSKRWRTLFAFTHNLDFDDPIVMGNVWDKPNYRSFRDFVYRTLALQGGNHIKKLSLRVKYNYGAGGVVVLKHWIYYALKHRISELHLCIKCINTEKLFFSRIFTSTTLVKLSLGRKFRMYSFPSDISLPALKVLILDSILINGNQLSDVFLAACPALEDLIVRHMYYRVESYVISSKTIKRLSFTCKGYSYFYDDVISLNTPNVVDLYYYNYASQQRYLHCNLESLAKATLDLNSDDKDHVDVTNLISGIRNVKTLHLTFSAVEVISVCCKGGLLVFNNLVDLVFSSKKKDWKVVLPHLLERSPKLRTLVLLGLHRYTFNNRRFVGIRIPPKNRIKMLSIMQYQGNEDELKHISHFLLNMECLEVVKVYVAPTMDDPKKMQLTEDLMKLPTTSSKLKIQVM